MQIFHLYRGSWRRYARTGDFTKAAIKTIITYPRYIRGRRYKPLRVGYVVRSLAAATCSWSRFYDGTRTRFLNNTAIIIKRRGLFKSKYLYTPLSRCIRRNQYRILFPSFF